MVRISNNVPILIENKGKYVSENLDDFLNIYEDLGDYFNKKLIPINSVCDWFGDDFASLQSSQEIKNYIQFSDRENPKYFEHLLQLESALNKTNCNSPIRSIL